LRIIKPERLKKIDEKVLAKFYERQSEENPELAKDQKQGEKYVKGEKWSLKFIQYNNIIVVEWKFMSIASF